MLRRTAGSLVRSVLGGVEGGAAPVCASSSLLSTSFNGTASYNQFKRGYSDHETLPTGIVGTGAEPTFKILPTPTGLPPTTHVMLNPTADIEYFEKTHKQLAPGGDESKRAFTYMVLTTGRFVYASAIRMAVIKFLMSLSANKATLAAASVEVDIKNIQVGQTVTVKWRGKPGFIRRRTAEEIADALAVPMTDLRDPVPDSQIAKVAPEWIIVVGVCTHLGCVPISNAGEYLGWYCPCHGSHYDNAGRIRKGPAPYNLEVPPYKFLTDTTVYLGN